MSSTALQPVVTRDNALVPVSAARDLAVVTQAIHDDGAAFGRISRNKGDFVDSTNLQRAARSIAQAETNHPSMLLGGGFLGAVAGVVIGGAAAVFGLDVSFMLIAGSTTAVGLSVFPVSLTVDAIASKAKDRASKKLVPLASVQPLLARLETTEGVERTLVHATAQEWFHALRSHNALEPETRVAFERALAAEDARIAQAPQNAPVLRARIDVLKALVATIEKPGKVTSEVVGKLADHIEKLPEAERGELTGAIVQQLAGRDITYEGKHALYDLQVKYDLV